MFGQIVGALRKDNLITVMLLHELQDIEGTYGDRLYQVLRIIGITGRQAPCEMADGVNIAYAIQNIERLLVLDINRIITHPMLSEEAIVIFSASDGYHVITISF